MVSAGGTDGRSLVAFDAGEARVAGLGRRHGSLQPTVPPFWRRCSGSAAGGDPDQGALAGHDPATGVLLREHPFPARTTPTSRHRRRPRRRSVARLVGVRHRQQGVPSWSRGDVSGRTMRLGEPAPEVEVCRPRPRTTARVRPRRRRADLHRSRRRASGARRAGATATVRCLLAGGLLVVQTEEGEIVLVRAGPAAAGGGGPADAAGVLGPHRVAAAALDARHRARRRPRRGRGRSQQLRDPAAAAVAGRGARAGAVPARGRPACRP